MKKPKLTRYQLVIFIIGTVVVFGGAAASVILYLDPQTAPVNPLYGAQTPVPDIFALGLSFTMLLSYIVIVVLMNIQGVRRIGIGRNDTDPEVIAAVERETVSILCEINLISAVGISYFTLGIMGAAAFNTALFMLSYFLYFAVILIRVIRIHRIKKRGA